MSKFQAALDLYTKELKDKAGVTANADLLKAVTKACGPAIYNPDACKVSMTDQTEVDRVKNNFLIKKLGLSDGPALDAALGEVAEKLGKSNRNKYRAMVYYLLVQKFGKESVFAK